MAVEDLPPGTFFTPTRDELIDRNKRDYLLLNPDADVTSGQPDLDARHDTDLVVPLHANARSIAAGINEDAATGEQLDRVGNRIERRRGTAKGATGYVAVETGPGGALYESGVNQLQNKGTKFRYVVGETKHCNNGEHIFVRALDTGPSTDVPPDTILSFVDPPPGSGSNATVVEQSGGRGLSGGAETESDQSFLAGIQDRKRNPAGGDNDAEIRKVLLETPDVPVEQVFTYPGFFAGGSSAFTFTVLASVLGATRIPTDAQVKVAFDWLRSQMPGDNSYFPLVPTQNALVMAFSVSWATGGWADVAPFPSSYASNVIVSSSGNAPLSFSISGGSTTPVVGQSIGVWDRAKGIFRRKRILTVTGTGPWALTCTSQNGASDTSYTPLQNQLVSPWSDNLLKVATPVMRYLATLGPGQAFAALDSAFSEGRRRLRYPALPKSWPSKTTNKVTTDVTALAEVADATALAGVGVDVSASIPPKLSELSDLAFFTG